MAKTSNLEVVICFDVLLMMCWRWRGGLTVCRGGEVVVLARRFEEEKTQVDGSAAGGNKHEKEATAWSDGEGLVRQCSVRPFSPGCPRQDGVRILEPAQQYPSDLERLELLDR